MNIIKWWRQRKQVKENKAHNQGYGWAWDEYRKGRMSIDEIKAKASDDHPFDRGAHAAIADIVKSGL